jgi:hypothetical protein
VAGGAGLAPEPPGRLGANFTLRGGDEVDTAELRADATGYEAGRCVRCEFHLAIVVPAEAGQVEKSVCSRVQAGLLGFAGRDSTRPAQPWRIKWRKEPLGEHAEAATRSIRVSVRHLLGLLSCSVSFVRTH